IPIVERVAREPSVAGVRALVLVPTRELAIQVAGELAKMCANRPFRVGCVYGGVGFAAQHTALADKRTAILVATPGRLLDHLGSGKARLDRVAVLVLDEADRMLDMGFLPDVERVLARVPARRQTMLFSATLPAPIRKLSERILRDPADVSVGEDVVTTPLARQFQLTADKHEKQGALLALLAAEKPKKTLVFVRTKHGARRLGKQLAKTGYDAGELHGDMSQNARARAMDMFRSGRLELLVATDVASRGLDVPDVSHVVNYDLPMEPEAYVHRVGRTGRMGKEGRAFTFVQRDQKRDLATIERVAAVQMEPYALAFTRVAEGENLRARGPLGSQTTSRPPPVAHEPDGPSPGPNRRRKPFHAGPVGAPPRDARGFDRRPPRRFPAHAADRPDRAFRSEPSTSQRSREAPRGQGSREAPRFRTRGPTHQFEQGPQGEGARPARRGPAPAWTRRRRRY
ncbi:MAG TPA: helicase-related protein, partial [Candidatus Thermoplasmatota archaeon]|nr:helicase-related protein [Candidatus Thermoplasmatota archaeon]